MTKQTRRSICIWFMLANFVGKEIVILLFMCAVAIIVEVVLYLLSCLVLDLVFNFTSMDQILCLILLLGIVFSCAVLLIYFLLMGYHTTRT